MITMSKQYQIRPSQIIALTNDYEAFCFDEACTYILAEMSKENGTEPKFEDNKNVNKQNNSDVIDWLNSNNK
ncbi:Uncharacterised protein [Clostridium tetani]|nr:hypothetical protein K134307016_09510 [Clostridium tetani]BDR78012.1 hypothetical protein K154307017_09450 [Clostridium tetani]BDR83538.1 hypothetical protein K254310026_09490 [Clostridium tetani]SUY55141.1 Uncharacterised protein [Clostridium tetani]